VKHQLPHRFFVEGRTNLFLNRLLAFNLHINEILAPTSTQLASLIPKQDYKGPSQSLCIFPRGKITGVLDISNSRENSVILRPVILVFDLFDLSSWLWIMSLVLIKYTIFTIIRYVIYVTCFLAGQSTWIQAQWWCTSSVVAHSLGSEWTEPDGGDTCHSRWTDIEYRAGAAGYWTGPPDWTNKVFGPYLVSWLVSLNFMVRTDRHSPAGFLVRCSAQTSPLFVVEWGRQSQYRSVYTLCNETLAHQ